MNKYKPGDKVRIKNLGINPEDVKSSNELPGIWVKSMLLFQGKIATIKTVFRSSFYSSCIYSVEGYWFEEPDLLSIRNEELE